jgi:hypothetical protein
VRKKDKQKKLEKSRQHAASFRKIKRSRDEVAQGRSGRATLADALDQATVKKLADLKSDLERAANAKISKQLNQEKPPWTQYVSVPAESLIEIPISEPKRTEVEKVGPKVSPSKSDWRNEIAPRVYIDQARPEKPKFVPQKKQKKLADSQFEYWSLPKGAAARETPPELISKDEMKDVEAILDIGVIGDLGNGQDDAIFANIGLDFGTSSTKAIVRLPFETGEPTFAISMPPFCQSDYNPHLWQTIVWLDQNENFYPYPIQDATAHRTLKQDLMQSTGEATSLSPMGDIQATDLVEEKATAYLTFVIRYIRGRVLTDFSQVFRGRSPIWFVNVGLAAAGYDDKPMLMSYRKIASAALLLASTREDVSVLSTRSFLRHQTVRNAAKSGEASEELGIAVIPETVAEATGFTKTVAAGAGLFTLIDVGATTLDVCTFGLKKDAAKEDELPLFYADVKPLGVEAYHWFMKAGKQEEDFEEQCERMLKRVIWTTKLKRHRSAKCWNEGNDLPVFLTGGGALNSIHKHLVEALGPWLSTYTRNEGVRVLPLVPPNTIETAIDIVDFGRLAVAWGLSYPPTEIGKPIPPSAIADDSQPEVSDYSGAFISKDQV